jgi:hypothetical protein
VPGERGEPIEGFGSLLLSDYSRLILSDLLHARPTELSLVPTTQCAVHDYEEPLCSPWRRAFEAVPVSQVVVHLKFDWRSVQTVNYAQTVCM